MSSLKRKREVIHVAIGTLEFFSLEYSLRDSLTRRWQPTPVILAWEIPWTEEPSRLCTVHGVSKEPDTIQQLNSNNLPPKVS